jgi:hydroxyethylthiazole kinase
LGEPVKKEADLMENYADCTAQNLAAVRQNGPLVHNITNFVVMNFTANVLLAMGASPVMAHAPNEVEEMAAMANALVLNIGTLTDEWVASMIKAGQRAALADTPIILDPVGAGATTFRTASAQRIINQTRVHVIRGNASEIMSFSDSTGATKGVETTLDVEDIADEARKLADKTDITMAVTGAVDLISDGDRVVRVANGHPMMARVTGTGCAATAIIGAFMAVDADPVRAAVTALAYYGVAGELAANAASGPGSFVPALIDALHNIKPDELPERVRIEETRKY